MLTFATLEQSAYLLFQFYFLFLNMKSPEFVLVEKSLNHTSIKDALIEHTGVVVCICEASHFSIKLKRIN